MIDVPETPRQRGDRGRLTMFGHRVDDGSRCKLQFVEELDGSWTIHGPGAGVTLTALDAVLTCEMILERAHEHRDQGRAQ